MGIVGFGTGPASKSATEKRATPKRNSRCLSEDFLALLRAAVRLYQSFPNVDEKGNVHEQWHCSAAVDFLVRGR